MSQSPIYRQLLQEARMLRAMPVTNPKSLPTIQNMDLSL